MWNILFWALAITFLGFGFAFASEDNKNKMQIGVAILSFLVGIMFVCVGIKSDVDKIDSFHAENTVLKQQLVEARQQLEQARQEANNKPLTAEKLETGTIQHTFTPK